MPFVMGYSNTVAAALVSLERPAYVLICDVATLAAVVVVYQEESF
jgi:hypothetical protein